MQSCLFRRGFSLYDAKSVDENDRVASTHVAGDETPDTVHGGRHSEAEERAIDHCGNNP